MSKDSFEKSVDLAVPRSVAWAMLADYGNPHHYAPSIVDAHVTNDIATGVGAVRHCDLPRMMGMKQHIVEEIDVWEEGVALGYVITDASAPIQNGRADWRVEGDASSSRIVVRITYEPKGLMGTMMAGMMKKEFRTQMDESLAQIKSSLEKVHRRAG